MIAVVDYGAGNLASVMKAFRAVSGEPRLVTRPEQLAGATGIVIPGVGHFEATRTLHAGWRSAIRAHIEQDRPLLGICLGMQWLHAGSDEAGGLEGLGIFEGRVVRLKGDVKVPHVGWNSLDSAGTSPLLEGVGTGTSVYFTHSYAAPVGDGTMAVAEHGMPFAAIVERGNVAGMQFHPEKSGRAGLTLLRNWVSRAL